VRFPELAFRCVLVTLEAGQLGAFLVQESHSPWGVGFTAHPDAAFMRRLDLRSSGDALGDT
jgi:hypothetical protein